MIAWWRARRGWVVVGANLLFVAAVLLLRVDILLPNVVAGQTNLFPLGYAAAFLPGLVWVTMSDNRPRALEATGVRRRQLAVLDYALAVGLPVAAATGLGILGQPISTAAARNVVLVAAISVVASETLPIAFAFLAPLGYLLAAGTAGFELLAPRPAGWALILDEWVPERDWWVLAVSLIASFAIFLGSRTRSSPRIAVA